MPDREKVIEALQECKELYRGETCTRKSCPYYTVPLYCNRVLLNDALVLLKEQDKIKEQLIEAFNTIRNAYNVPANREKILLNYLLRIAGCCE